MGTEMKSRSLWFGRMGKCVAFVAGFIALTLMCSTSIAAEPKRSLIFVVDSSERMTPHIFSVKGLIFTAADQAKRGDNLGIISFAETPEKVALKKISAPRDKQSIEYRLEAMETSGETGNVALGVARALDEVVRLHRKRDRSLKGVIVISASKSPDPWEASRVLSTALSDLSKYVAKKEWYIQYCYLDGIRDQQVERFVSANQGISYDVDALRLENRTNMIEELYRIISTPEDVCPVEIIDIKGIILGKETGKKEWVPLKAGTYVSEATQLRVALNSRAVLEMHEFGKIGLDADADLYLERARKGLFTRTGRFDVALERGTIWIFCGKKKKAVLGLKTTGAVIDLCGAAGSAQYYPEMQRVRVTAFEGPFSIEVKGKAGNAVDLGAYKSVNLEAGRMLEDTEPVDANILEEWKSWKRALAKGMPLAKLDFAIPEVEFFEEIVTIGPIRSGERIGRNLTIRVSGVDDLSKAKMGVDISLALPDGLAISTRIDEGEEPQTKTLRLEVDGSRGFKSRRADTYPGLLSIVPAKDSKVLFEKTSIPITVQTKGPMVPRTVLAIGVGLILLGAIAGGVLSRFRSSVSARPKPHSVIGRLITVNDPTGGRIGTINLEELGTKSSRLSLVVGRDRAVDVRLKHASVSREHGTLEAHLLGGRLETFIEPVGAAKVEVDGQVISSRTRLNDGVKIKMGDLICQFEDTQLYRKVELMRRNGKRISGILDAAGMDAEGFRLSPMDAVSPSERARIKFSDIRYAVFYRRVADILSETPRRVAKTGSMKKIELMLRKGETISGHVQREYVEERRKYVELIPLDPESKIDYTVVDYSAVVEKRAL